MLLRAHLRSFSSCNDELRHFQTEHLYTPMCFDLSTAAIKELIESKEARTRAETVAHGWKSDHKSN